MALCFGEGYDKSITLILEECMAQQVVQFLSDLGLWAIPASLLIGGIINLIGLYSIRFCDDCQCSYVDTLVRGHIIMDRRNHWIIGCLYPLSKGSSSDKDEATSGLEVGSNLILTNSFSTVAYIYSY